MSGSGQSAGTARRQPAPSPAPRFSSTHARIPGRTGRPCYPSGADRQFRHRSHATAAAAAHLRAVAHARFGPCRRPGAADRRALAGRPQVVPPGHQFPGWLFRIQRNEFISGLRRERPTVELNDAIISTLSQAAATESGLVMREFMTAFRTLARRAATRAADDGAQRPVHETIAGTSGVSIGTIKSRVSRARARLRQMLDVEVGDFSLAAPSRPARPRCAGRLIAASAARQQMIRPIRGFPGRRTCQH